LEAAKDLGPFHFERMESHFQTYLVDLKELRRRPSGDELRADAWAPNISAPQILDNIS